MTLPIHLSIHPPAYPPMLLSTHRVCFNVFVTYIRVLKRSHPIRWLENRQHHLKSNDITKQHFPPRRLTCQRICHSGSCSAGPCLGIFGVRCCSKPFANIQHPRAASFSKEDEQRTALTAMAFQEKVGAKVVKIALEELFLPTPLHPSSTSFFTFSFAAFCMSAKENRLYLMPNCFREKKVRSFFGRRKFLHWFLCPRSHGKNWLLQPTT